MAAADNTPNRMNSSSKLNTRVTAAAFVLSVVIFLAYAYRFFNYVEDDAFIPMRYALNFWHGFGWVMNSGERVEGCTSPLQLALVTALIHFAGPDTLLYCLKILGLVFGIAILRQSQILANLVFPSASWPARLVPLLIALRPDFAASMINGLETGLAAFLVTGGVIAFIQAAGREGESDHRLSALWFLGAALTRPELSLLFPLLLAGSYLTRRPRDTSWSAFLLYAGPLALFLVARFTYYGSLLPNTYWAKHLPLHQSVPLGLTYLANFALPCNPWMAAILYSLGAIRILRIAGIRRWVLLTPLLIHTLFLLRSGGDWMSDVRFFILLLPLCAIVWTAAVLQVVEICFWLADNSPRLRLAPLGVLILLLMISANLFRQDTQLRAALLAAQPGIGSFEDTLQPHKPLEEWKIGNASGRLAIGRWISAHARPGQTVLTSEMGLSTIVNPEIRFLDMRGLTDFQIARMAGTQRDLSGTQGEREWMDQSKPLGQYLRRRRPEWVALLWDVYRSDTKGATDENTLYAPSGTFIIHCDGRNLTVATWKRRDVASVP